MWTNHVTIKRSQHLEISKRQYIILFSWSFIFLGIWNLCLCRWCSWLFWEYWKPTIFTLLLDIKNRSKKSFWIRFCSMPALSSAPSHSLKPIPLSYSPLERPQDAGPSMPPSGESLRQLFHWQQFSKMMAPLSLPLASLQWRLGCLQKLSFSLKELASLCMIGKWISWHWREGQQEVPMFLFSPPLISHLWIWQTHQCLL